MSTTRLSSPIYQQVLEELKSNPREAWFFLHKKNSGFNVNLVLVNKFYSLSSSEKTKLVNFFSQFQPVSYHQTLQLKYHFSKKPPVHFNYQPLLDISPFNWTRESLELFKNGKSTLDETGRKLNSSIGLCKSLTELRSIIEMIFHFDPSIEWSVLLINKMLHKCAEYRGCEPSNFDGLFKIITRFHVHFENRTCTLLLNLCELNANLSEAKSLLFGDGDKKSLMEVWGIKPNPHICNAYINVCGSAKKFEAAWELVYGTNPLMKIGVQSKTSPIETTCVCLLSVCAKTERFEEAYFLLFGNAAQQSLIKSWNLELTTSMCNKFIEVCTSTGKSDLAWKLVCSADPLMKVGKYSKTAPNAITCMKLLLACKKAGNLTRAKQLLFGDDGKNSLIDAWGVKLNTPMCNCYVNFCSNIGEFESAWQLISGANPLMRAGVHSETTPDELTCSYLLFACAKAERFKEAKQLFFDSEATDGQVSLMKKWGVRPNTSICNNYINVCASTGEFDSAWQLVCGINPLMKAGAESNTAPDVITCIYLLNACAKALRFKEAKLLVLGNDDSPFDDSQKSLMERWGIKLTTKICSKFINICGHCREFETAWNLVCGAKPLMQVGSQSNTAPDAATCITLLTACYKAERFDEAKKLLFGDDSPDGQKSLIEEWGIVLDTGICNNYINVCGSCGQFEAAWELVCSDNPLMGRGVDSKTAPDAITCMNLLTACANAGRFKEATLLLIGNGSPNNQKSLIEEWGIKLDTAMCNNYIKVCENVGEFEVAWELACGANALMKTDAGSNTAPDLITCVSLLNACAKAKRFKEATLLLFGDSTPDGQKSWMEIWGVVPDTPICISFINVCSNTGRIDAAQRLVTKMEEWNVPMTVDIYAHLMLLKSAHFNDAIEEGLRLGRLYPNLGVRNGCLDLHADKVINANAAINDYPVGVPLEFAKLLYSYLKDVRQENIESIIAGHHGEATLNRGMIEFTRQQYQQEFVSEVNNPGLLRLK